MLALLHPGFFAPPNNVPSPIIGMPFEESRTSSSKSASHASEQQGLAPLCWLPFFQEPNARSLNSDLELESYPSQQYIEHSPHGFWSCLDFSISLLFPSSLGLLFVS
ncbi:hypothetical protein I3843_09G134900 [Carya illinoinensis]|nr:hypothetical protein I3843_09G134900 [Carya illinoinensis]